MWPWNYKSDEDKMFEAFEKGLTISCNNREENLEPINNPNLYRNGKWYYEEGFEEEGFNVFEYDSDGDVVMRDATKEKEFDDVVTEIQELQCVICLDNKKCKTLIPCNHLCVCHKCSKEIEECPICRSKFNKIQHNFI